MIIPSTDPATEPADSNGPAGLLHHCLPEPHDRNIAPSPTLHTKPSLILPAAGYDIRSEGRL
jgi:hypothetical protein